MHSNFRDMRVSPARLRDCCSSSRLRFRLRRSADNSLQEQQSLLYDPRYPPEGKMDLCRGNGSGGVRVGASPLISGSKRRPQPLSTGAREYGAVEQAQDALEAVAGGIRERGGRNRESNRTGRTETPLNGRRKRVRYAGRRHRIREAAAFLQKEKKNQQSCYPSCYECARVW
jgi:hypothetical protein